MRYLTNNATDPHFNMAFDEAVMEWLPLGEPVFYLWQNRPAVIIGLNQSAYGEVNLPYLEEHGIVLARRVTGGGAVYHDLGNLNYSIVGRTADMDADLPHYLSLVRDALHSLGVPAEVSGRNDIMVEGRKCSGYAKRLFRDRMMIHGTLMFDVDLEVLTRALSVPGSKLSAAGVASVRSRVCNLSDYLPGWTLADFRAALKDFLAATPVWLTESAGWEEMGETPAVRQRTACAELSPRSDGVSTVSSRRPVSQKGEVALPEGFLDMVEQLAQKKFRTWEWIYGQSPATDFCVRRKFPSCGTIEARYSVRHGLLADVRFSGDFLGALPLDAPLPEGCPAAGKTLAEALNGTRYTPEAITAVLTPLPVSRYFDGLTPEALIALFF